MKVTELRKKTKEDLLVLLDERQRRKDEMVGLLREKKVKNVKELWRTRKEVAQILTILKEESFTK